MDKKAILAVLVCAIFASSLFVTGVFAQSIPKPSVPEFSIETNYSPYDVPPTATSSISPYTNLTSTTTIPGYHVENRTTVLKIKNQPFTPYKVQQNGDWTVNLFYNIQIKGYFDQNWGNYKWNNGSGDRNLSQDYNSQFTIVQIDEYLPKEGQVDFRVQALEGYQHGVDVFPGIPGERWIITGSASDWSPTHTITISNTSPSSELTLSPTVSSSLSPSPSPTHPIAKEIFPIWVIAEFAALAFVIGLLVVVVVMQRRRIRENKNSQVS